MIHLINIGYGNMVNTARVVAVVSPESAPIQDSRDRGALIDATHGRKTQSVIVTDSDHVILTYLPPESIQDRLAGEDDEKKRVIQ